VCVCERDTFSLVLSQCERDSIFPDLCHRRREFYVKINKHLHNLEEQYGEKKCALISSRENKTTYSRDYERAIAFFLPPKWRGKMKAK